MRILDLRDLGKRPVEHHGSEGFFIARLGAGQSHVATVQLEPGGRIGRHPAVGRQLLVVITGTALVSGQEAGVVRLGPAQAAVWESGEEHETRTTDGLVAVIVEGDIDA